MTQTKIRDANAPPTLEDTTEDEPATVAERPSLAPSVTLSGEMQESGFEEQQWLVQRDGQFVQLAELLYRLLEQVNGERTLEEIAAGMSRTTGRNVSAGNVRRLIENKLVPLGLIVQADGSVQGEEDRARGTGSRSPLQISMRTRVVSPDVINPITRVLQYLYWPPILIAILLISALAQAWLYLDHGIANGMYQILYRPGYLLLLLAIIIISTAFHELGHASALRYGGGEVRGMGVGLYLVYPAFYTDVTDNYRLPRWSRVRTDLGGFYFNLIFALLMLTLYALTKQEFLLLVVLLVDLEIIHQTLPFVRLDGYWALADLTGIPDFFSQIMPFVRTVMPLPWWREGRTLPNLKGWVKAVFALYILITIPLLLVLFFLMIESVPRVLATAWDSLGKQENALSAAWAHGNILAILSSILQMVLLALPTVGMLYVLFSVGRRVTQRLWTWSKPTPARRVVGGLVGSLLILLLGYMWFPRLPIPGLERGTPYSSTLWRPIGPGERGTLLDAIHLLVPVGEGKTAAAGAKSGRVPTHDAFVDTLRRIPVLGGVVSAVAPEHAPLLSPLRGVPVLGGIVSTLAPRHGSLLDSIRSVPVVGGVVNYVAPAPAPTGQHSGSSSSHPGAPSSGGAPSSTGSSAPGGSPGGSNGTGPGSSGIGPIPMPTGAAGAAPTAVGGVTGAVGTPAAGVVGTVNGVVTTPLAGVQGTVTGAVQSPVAGLPGSATRLVQTPVSGVSGVARTPVAAVTAVGGLVKTPVAAGSGALGTVKTPVAAGSGAVGTVKTQVAGASGAPGAVATPVAGVHLPVP